MYTGRQDRASMISQDRNSLKSRGRYWDATGFDDAPRTATPLDRKMFKQDNPATEILDRKLITNKPRASSEHHDGNDRLAVREGLKLGLQVGGRSWFREQSDWSVLFPCEIYTQKMALDDDLA